MLYSYGSFLFNITLFLLCIMMSAIYYNISPSKKRDVQVVYGKMQLSNKYCRY